MSLNIPPIYDHFTEVSNIFLQKPEMMSNFINLQIDILQQFQNSLVFSKNKTSDKRFKAKEWEDGSIFNFIKDSYLMWSSVTENVIKSVAPKDEYLHFLTKQIIDAYSPSNFLLTNPQALKATLDTNFQNIVNGTQNFIEDLKNSDKFLQISNCDKSDFILGKNIASTEGKIIFQNDLMQLIYYKPQEKTWTVPIFVVPPWINKYYILDLSEENSFINYMIENGYEVFLVSWVNPNESLGDKNFEDYLYEGIIEPIEYLIKELKRTKFNIMGYCIGGTLVASALSYMKKTSRNYINSATFLTTLLDFTEPGALGLFVQEPMWEKMLNLLNNNKVFDGSIMSATFNALKPNEMIWNSFINNYLLGKKPIKFDLLYWNSDYTNLPSTMHHFYLENMYKYNLLKEPNKIVLKNVPIDLGVIDIPCFFFAAKDDHIVPWKSSFVGSRLLSGMVEFCLGTSGHVAGVINPPKKNKYSYFHGSLDNDVDSWFSKTKEEAGSWWNYWEGWQKQFSGKWMENNTYKMFENFIEKAPGSYVLMKHNL